MEQKHKRQNIKRWIAVITAFILFVFSISSTVFSNRYLKSQSNQLVNNLIANGLNENVDSGSDIANRILVIPIHGQIMGNMTGEYDHELVVQSIKKAQEDPTIKGILLDIDTPGGSVYESAEVFNRLYALREKSHIPIVATMGAYAASGGYYIASAANEIYAANETTTGSIGVILSYLNLKGLYEKLGIKGERFATGEYKAIPYNDKDLDDKQRQFLEDSMNSAYNRFIDAVSKGRHMKKDDVLKLADGRTFFGDEAVKNGLVDHIGYYEDALDDLKKQIGSDNAQVFSYQRSPFDFKGQLPFPFSLLSQKGDAKAVMNELIQPELPQPAYLYGGE